VPVLRTLAEGGFQGAALANLGYRGERLANVNEALGITVEATARGARDGRLVPAGICWVVERSFNWLSRHGNWTPSSSARGSTSSRSLRSPSSPSSLGAEAPGRREVERLTSTNSYSGWSVAIKRLPSGEWADPRESFIFFLNKLNH
jgi:hypothetical protein